MQPCLAEALSWSTTSGLCQIQEFADDTAILGCIRDEEKDEYTSLVSAFVTWSQKNLLQFNTSKPKEMVIDFRRSVASEYQGWQDGRLFPA